jgi:hypothetical protein
MRDTLKSRRTGAFLAGASLLLIAAAGPGAAAPHHFWKSAAAPHHFWKSAEGEVVAADAGGHSFTVRSSRAAEPVAYTWNDDTRFFDGEKREAGSAAKSDSGELHAGERVRVEYQAKGDRALAKRVVIRPATKAAAAQ